MAVKEGILTILLRQPTHGYQLKLELERSVGDTWTVNVGQIYTTLQRLERDGLVESAGFDDHNRIIYRVTPPGRSHTLRWMQVPEPLATANRDEVSLKVLLAISTGVADPRRVLEVQRGATMSSLQDYVQLKGSDGGDLAWQVYLDRLIFSAEAELRWLERVEARLEELPEWQAPADSLTEPASEPIEVEQ